MKHTQAVFRTSPRQAAATDDAFEWACTCGASGGVSRKMVIARGEFEALELGREMAREHAQIWHNPALVHDAGDEDRSGPRFLTALL